MKEKHDKAICYLCEKETRYKNNPSKILVCEYCTMELCKNTPRKHGDSLELLKFAMEMNRREE